ncbi:carbon-nitrogen hydrolase family protein, partial [bacterium]|nr:carbon-nitrogen hydrolase family protein [bacterium]
MKSFIVAGAQISVKPNDVEYNVKKSIKWMEKAVKDCKPDLLVFPETITTGFSTNLSPEELYDIVDTIPGKITDRIAEVAKRLKIYVVFPTYERGEKRGEIYNSASLIDSNGKIVGVYRKTHPFSLENVHRGGWVIPGTKAP